MIDTEVIAGILKKHYSPETYDHCRRTAATASHLAGSAGCDKLHAVIASWLHDYAKELEGPKLVAHARRLDLPVTEVDLQNPYLLHGPVGACLVRDNLELDEPWLMDAIAKHTYGSSLMSTLDKVIYLADVIEPGRNFAGLERIRRAAEGDLEMAFRMAYEGQMMFVLSQKKPLHPVSIEVWNSLVVA